MERKGAAYKITQKRDAQDPNNVTSGGRHPSGSNIPETHPPDSWALNYETDKLGGVAHKAPRTPPDSWALNYEQD